MSAQPSPAPLPERDRDPDPERAARLDILIAFRADLHRYCARLTGSIFDGEDLAQATLSRACDPAVELAAVDRLRPWIFRIAHNLAMDHLRAQARRATEPLEAAAGLADETVLDPAEALARREATAAAVERFLELPTLPRSAVILKDVLDHSLAEIAELLELSLSAVKAALHRGRRRLQELNAQPAPTPLTPAAPSPELRRYIALFNAREWAQLRSLLGETVRMEQVGVAVRHGPVRAGEFFTRYAATTGWRLTPGWLEGREIAVVLGATEGASPVPLYFMELGWQGGQLASIRDFRHARQVVEGASLLWAAEPVGPLPTSPPPASPA